MPESLLKDRQPPAFRYPVRIEVAFAIGPDDVRKYSRVTRMPHHHAGYAQVRDIDLDECRAI